MRRQAWPPRRSSPGACESSAWQRRPAVPHPRSASSTWTLANDDSSRCFKASAILRASEAANFKSQEAYGVLLTPMETMKAFFGLGSSGLAG